MVANTGSKKKSGSTRRRVDVGEKDRLIAELKEKIRLLENELRLKQEDATSLDVTERKRAEEALRESEEKFRVLAETMPVAICLYQGDRFIYVNQATERITGYTRDELLNLKLWDMLPPGFREQLRERWEDRSLGKPVPSRYEVRFRTKNGELRWIDVSMGSINAGGNPAVFAAAIDITEHKRAEEALKKERDFVSAVLDTVGALIIVLDREGRTVRFNRACEELTDYSFDEVKGRPFWDILIAPEEMTPVKETFGRLTAGEFPNHFMNFWVAKDKTRRLIAWSNTAVTGGDGAVDYVIGTGIDITESSRAEEELIAAKQQAELYLDLMGHDINNMHQIALGYLELSRDMHPDAVQGDYLDTPIEVLQRSAQLIKNVRKLQKLHDGVFQIEPVDVAKVLVDVQREFGAVPHKAVTLNLNGCEQCHVRANELLHDVFANLVSNSIKHTGERADIVVDLDVVWNDGRQYCRVMVEDDGPGISDDFKGRIFNRLLKGTDKAKGMGLGLYLVKSLVDSYSGRVWVEDRVPGDHTKGARFVVMLPAVNN